MIDSYGQGFGDVSDRSLKYLGQKVTVAHLTGRHARARRLSASDFAVQRTDMCPFMPRLRT